MKIYDSCEKERSATKKPTTNPEWKDESQTILDLRTAGGRRRGSDMEKIIREMDTQRKVSEFDNENNENQDSTEDDLIALIDSQL